MPKKHRQDVEPKETRKRREPPANQTWLDAPPLTPSEIAQIAAACGGSVRQSPSGTLIVDGGDRDAAGQALAAIMRAREQVRAKKSKKNATYTPEEWAAMTIDERLEALAARVGLLEKPAGGGSGG